MGQGEGAHLREPDRALPHTRAETGEIDRKALRAYKRNLGVISSRYTDSERAALDGFAADPDGVAQFQHDMSFEFVHLLKDGLLEERTVSDWGMRVGGNLIPIGPRSYALTAVGRDFLARWLAGDEVD